ncbi:MAG: hypothetical protein IPI01_14825 [Ignavibacteriae bacterium]|nr:hypothetical protein [Ignavibacteriota bacterium]
MNGSRLLPLVVLLTACVATSGAQYVSGRVSTAVYGWEQFDTVGVSQQRVRAYQTAQLTVSQGDFSLTTFLQGSTNLAGSFGDAGRVRFYNLYLSWLNIGKVAEVHLGRQSVYAGVGVGSLDGLVARARLLNNTLTITGYGGAVVGPEFTMPSKFADNAMYGGQVVTTALPGARIGLSYMKRQEERDPYWTIRARDTSFSPVPLYIEPSADAEELASADARYNYGERLSVYGRYDHDMLNERTARAQGGARVQITERIAVSADYIHRLPRVMYNSIFSAFVSNAVDELEGGVEYGFTPMVRAFGRVAAVSYTDEKSTRWTVGLNTGYATIAYAGSDGYAGELTSLSAQASYPLFGKVIIPTAGFSYASYRLSKESTKDNAIGVILGAAVRPTSAISFDVQGQWLTNKLMQRDLRVQARFSYWFAHRFSRTNVEGRQ